MMLDFRFRWSIRLHHKKLHSCNNLFLLTLATLSGTTSWKRSPLNTTCPSPELTTTCPVLVCAGSSTSSALCALASWKGAGRRPPRPHHLLLTLYWRSCCYWQRLHCCSVSFRHLEASLCSAFNLFTLTLFFSLLSMAFTLFPGCLLMPLVFLHLAYTYFFMGAYLLGE